MLIDCPACARSYNVSRSEIGDEGRAVICPRCDAHWFVHGAPSTALVPMPTDLRTQVVSVRASRPDFDAGAGHVARASLLRGARPILMGLACLLAATGVIGARQSIVRAAPRTAALYETLGLPVNVRGLAITANVPERVDAAQMTIVGAIRNVASHRTSVPRLVYEIRDAAGLPLATWTERAPVRTLGLGKSTPFVSSPHPLPPGAHSILVQFGADEGPVLTVKVAHRTS